MLEETGQVSNIRAHFSDKNQPCDRHKRIKTVRIGILENGHKKGFYIQKASEKTVEILIIIEISPEIEQKLHK